MSFLTTTENNLNVLINHSHWFYANDLHDLRSVEQRHFKDAALAP